DARRCRRGRHRRRGGARRRSCPAPDGGREPRRGRLDARAVHVQRRGRSPRRGRRLRLQAVDPAPACRRRRRGGRLPARRRRRHGRRLRRSAALAGARRSRAADGRDEDAAGAARAHAGPRRLPRAPAARDGNRQGDVQAAVRPPRRQPPGGRPSHPARARHVAEPRLRGRSRRRVRCHVQLALRRHRRRARLPRAARTLGAVPSRGLAGTARRGDDHRRLRRRAEGGLMPRRTDIESICLIGSGPIVIGQAAEFDYAGCQALKVLREDGFRTIVVNSNPATIMTGPGFADRTYREPLDLEGVVSVLERERPDALLPTMGGQTALNLARALATSGALRELGIDLIGANIDAINRAEDRELFKHTVESVGLKVPTSRIVTSPDELDGVALPAVVRPAFTLGGHGGGFADTHEQLVRQVERGLSESPIGQVLVEESVRGWDEFELEVVRDKADNVVIVCSIENLDPMGVHTGDSVTVAPQMTLSDEAYQELRAAAISVIRAVGVDTGGSNIQFARDRVSGDIRVIEMNPRVSRSSALASKATGYPIAKVAAKLAVGYTLDEIPNDLTGTTPASFEPTLDYVVVKIPRFAFEKFPGADT